jgi:glutathione synthase/RimK-type ligase-like ATP-grasp enzyme
MSFIRNLTFFEDAKWMNNPVDTFKAENKLLQLKYAKEVGLRIPNTFVTNNNSFKFKNSTMAVKSLDTALFKIDDYEAFFYTNIMTIEDIKSYDISLFPVVIQDNLEPKIDYRVTIAGNKMYSTVILEDGKGVPGDWRRRKNTLKFIDCDLPDQIKNKCFKLLYRLKLSFGGIDLIEHENSFFFLEVNPTGEWAWLVDSTNQKIYEGICDFLS